MIFLLQIKSILQRILRNLYWIFNSWRIKTGHTCKFDFPIIFEGKGYLEFGNHCKVSRKVILRYGYKSTVVFGNGICINESVNITANKDSYVIFGDNFSIGAGSKLYINRKWTFNRNVSIATNCQVFAREGGCYGELVIGEGSNIGDSTILDLSGNLTIGNQVAIGPGSTIYTHDHDYLDVADIVPWKGKPIVKDVFIGNGAWIGANVTILPGVSIGDNAIIAAGAVVTKSVGPNEIHGGVPAKFLKNVIRS